MNNLLEYEFTNFWSYVFWVTVASLVLRIFISGFESLHRGKNWFGPIFLGYGKENGEGERIAADYWLGFIIGWSEIFIFPILIKLSFMTYIAGWLVFKTANRMTYQERDRGPFNRYLAAHIYILSVSYFFARFIL